VATAHVELSRRAERDLRNLSPPDRRRLIRAVEQTLGQDPLPPTPTIVL
jgi:mRNA-degrading endonuclease RelE of RelBE toxin-antitoxin system